MEDPIRGAMAPMVRATPAIPIVPQMRASVDQRQRQHIASQAARLRKDEPALAASAVFGPLVTSGLGRWPSLVLEDHSAISLFEKSGNLSYGYRALLLAGSDDLVAIGVTRNLQFEDYCRELLNLGDVEVLQPQANSPLDPLAMRCSNDAALLSRLVRKARSHGGLNIVPYMGTGHVWVLAQKLAEQAEVPICVAAPAPRLTRRVNDKLWFSARVAELLSARSAPPSHPVFGMAALTARVAAFAKHHSTIAVKLPDSASSAGNFVFEAKELLTHTPKKLQRVLQRQLCEAGWQGRFPIMVTAWESPIVASPSVQLWIPSQVSDEVVIEGVFDQKVAGKRRAFTGVEPSSLGAEWQERLALGATKLGLLFQDLGYYGRCSFDAIIVGSGEARAELHWIECNGRWGGTSIPMTLANRLVGDWRKHPFVVVERNDLTWQDQTVDGFLHRIGDLNFDAHRQREGAVLLSPGQVERGRGFEIMLIGNSLDHAKRQAQRLCGRLSLPPV